MLRLAPRQAEGLIGSILQLLGLALALPDRTTLNCRAKALEMPRLRGDGAPMQRGRHLQFITKHGRAAWRKASGRTVRARAGAIIGRFKQAIDDGPCSSMDKRRATEVAVAVHALNRMLELGRPISVRIA